MQATLNGILTDDGGLFCDVRFEWGPTAAMGLFTPWQLGDGAFFWITGQSFSAIITGLQIASPYWFRAVARNAAGTSFGATILFTTPSTGSGGGGVVITLAATEVT